MKKGRPNDSALAVPPSGEKAQRGSRKGGARVPVGVKVEESRQDSVVGARVPARNFNNNQGDVSSKHFVRTGWSEGSSDNRGDTDASSRKVVVRAGRPEVFKKAITSITPRGTDVAGAGHCEEDGRQERGKGIASDKVASVAPPSASVKKGAGEAENIREKPSKTVDDNKKMWQCRDCFVPHYNCALNLCYDKDCPKMRQPTCCTHKHIGHKVGDFIESEAASDVKPADSTVLDAIKRDAPAYLTRVWSKSSIMIHEKGVTSEREEEAKEDFEEAQMRIDLNSDGTAEGEVDGNKREVKDEEKKHSFQSIESLSANLENCSMKKKGGDGGITSDKAAEATQRGAFVHLEGTSRSSSSTSRGGVQRDQTSGSSRGVSVASGAGGNMQRGVGTNASSRPTSMEVVAQSERNSGSPSYAQVCSSGGRAAQQPARKQAMEKAFAGKPICGHCKYPFRAVEWTCTGKECEQAMQTLCPVCASKHVGNGHKKERFTEVMAAADVPADVPTGGEVGDASPAASLQTIGDQSRHMEIDELPHAVQAVVSEQAGGTSCTKTGTSGSVGDINEKCHKQDSGERASEQHYQAEQLALIEAARAEAAHMIAAARAEAADLLATARTEAAALKAVGADLAKTASDDATPVVDVITEDCATIDAATTDKAHSIDDSSADESDSTEAANAVVAAAQELPDAETARIAEELMTRESEVFPNSHLPAIFDIFALPPPPDKQAVWTGGYTEKINRDLPVEGAKEATTELCVTLFPTEDKPKRPRNVLDTRYIMDVICQRSAAVDRLIGLATGEESFEKAPVPDLLIAKDHQFLPLRTCIVVPDRLRKERFPILTEVIQVTEQHLLCQPVCPLMYWGGAGFLRVLRVNRMVAVDMLSGCVGYRQERVAAGDHLWVLKLGLCPDSAKAVAGNKNWKEDMAKFDSREYRLDVQNLGAPKTPFQILEFCLVTPHTEMQDRIAQLKPRDEKDFEYTSTRHLLVRGELGTKSGRTSESTLRKVDPQSSVDFVKLKTRPQLVSIPCFSAALKDPDDVSVLKYLLNKHGLTLMPERTCCNSVSRPSRDALVKLNRRRNWGLIKTTCEFASDAWKEDIEMQKMAASMSIRDDRMKWDKDDHAADLAVTQNNLTGMIGVLELPRVAQYDRFDPARGWTRKMNVLARSAHSRKWVRGQIAQGTVVKAENGETIGWSVDLKFTQEMLCPMSAPLGTIVKVTIRLDVASTKLPPACRRMEKPITLHDFEWAAKSLSTLYGAQLPPGEETQPLFPDDGDDDDDDDDEGEEGKGEEEEEEREKGEEEEEDIEEGEGDEEREEQEEDCADEEKEGNDGNDLDNAHQEEGGVDEIENEIDEEQVLNEGEEQQGGAARESEEEEYGERQDYAVGNDYDSGEDQYAAAAEDDEGEAEGDSEEPNPENRIFTYKDVPRKHNVVGITSMTLAREQRRVLAFCTNLQEPIVNIDAAAGCGKTTVLALAMDYALLMLGIKNVLHIPVTTTNSAVAVIVEKCQEVCDPERTRVTRITSDTFGEHPTKNDILQQIIACADDSDAPEKLRSRAASLKNYIAKLQRLLQKSSLTEAETIDAERLSGMITEKRTFATKELLKYHRTNVLAMTVDTLSNIMDKPKHPVKKLINRHGHRVIVWLDETSQISENAFQDVCERVRQAIHRCIGDPRQLQPYGSVAVGRDAVLSLGQRLAGTGLASALLVSPRTPRLCLRECRRMHPELLQLASELFYTVPMRTSLTAADRKPPPSRLFPNKAPIAVITSLGNATPADGSMCNEAHENIAKQVSDHLSELLDEDQTIAILSFYRKPIERLRGAVARNVKLYTVDASQGREFDVVIVMTTRSYSAKAQYAFIEDVRRMNVSLTRVKRALVVIGHGEVLRLAGKWARVVKFASERGKVFTAAEAKKAM